MSRLRTLALMYGRNLRQFPRLPTVLVFGIAMPVIQLLLFGNVFSAITDLPGFPYADIPYYAYIAPAIVVLTTFLGMANSSAAFLVDLRTGYFDKLRTTPASAPLVIFGRLLAEMTRVAAQATMILLLALALGARIETGILGGVVMILASVVFSASVTGLLSMFLAMKTRSDQATQSAFPLFFVFLFLSTAYMPKSQLPGWLATVVGYNPMDYLIRGVRNLMLESWAEAAGPLLVAFACSIAIASLLSFVNMRVYRTIVE